MSIPLEDSASQETICDFDVSTVSGVINTLDLSPIEGVEESLSYNNSPTTRGLSSALEWPLDSDNGKRLKLR